MLFVIFFTNTLKPTIMKTIILITTAFALVFNLSCSSGKQAKQSEETDKQVTEMTANDRSMIEAGFKLGTVEVSTVEGDCPYTIKMEEGDTTYFLDPINLEESYKVQGQQLWFKYAGLRMMNRCDKASPISITEIQKREER